LIVKVISSKYSSEVDMSVSFDHRVLRAARTLPFSGSGARRRKWFDDGSLKATLILAALFISVWLGALIGLALLFARRV
jgi:hypothetical protein